MNYQVRFSDRCVARVFTVMLDLTALLMSGQDSGIPGMGSEGVHPARASVSVAD